MKRLPALSVLLCLLLAPAGLRAQTGAQELRAAIDKEREAANTVGASRAQRYDDVLRSYDRIFNSPDAAPEIKIEAKVRAGRVWLEEKNDPAKAIPLFDEGTRALAFREIVAMATVYSGKAMLATAKDRNELNAPLSEFDTVSRTYSTFPIAAEALMLGGSVLDIQHKYENAIINYQSVVFGFPDSPLAPVAFVRLGNSLARLGRTNDALGAYENLQLRYKGHPLAASAKKSATLLYRLYLLNARSPVIFNASVLAAKTESFKLDDPRRLTYLTSGDLVLIDKDKQFKVSPAGQVTPAEGRLPDCIDSRGGAYLVSLKTLVQPDSKPPLAPYIKKPDKQQPFDEIVNCGISTYGDLLVSTKGPEGIYRVDTKTGESLPFISTTKTPRKIARDSESNFYLLDEAGTTLTVVDSTGKTPFAITPTMTGIKEIADFALDTFDNLYLLDKQGKFIILSRIELGKDPKVTTLHKQDILEQSKPASNLRAIAVSPGGVVFVASKNAILAFQ